MSTTPPRRPSKAELNALVRTRRNEGLFSTIQFFIKWGSLTAIAAFVYLSIQTLAGRYTFADIGIRFLGDFKISESLVYLFGSGSILYGVGERRVRRSTIERLAKRIQELEKAIDPGRTSSKLTPRGTTRPEDSI